ncbi:MAG: quinate 5-dehydrogenase [Thermoanaerobacteraceae bacterium]|nr:quinate 5-dehydrogenase [Thermoanaerobacteraceae bacterium]
MKRVISISLGSSKRDHRVETNILGEDFIIERQGTDGDMDKAIELIKKYDGEVDAFGLGGADLYIYAGKKRYTIRDAAKMARAAQKTPIVDGSGLKNTLERRVIGYLHQNKGINFNEKKTLLVSGVDRFGMAEAINEIGGQLILGDLIFVLGIPVRLHSLKALERAARILAPVVCQMPFKLLYPTGSKQDQVKAKEKYAKFYHEADIIAGDFHYIKRHMPGRIDGKIIITNTVTADDVADLARRGARLLVTTTPELNGRSFGTNVMEAVLVSLIGKKETEITAQDYDELLDKIGFQPRIEYLA